MHPYSPDLIIANCPDALFFLDRWQYVIAEQEGITYGKRLWNTCINVEEIAGLLLGYDPWDIGLQAHQIAVEPLLDKIGIKYDSNEKI